MVTEDPYLTAHEALVDRVARLSRPRRRALLAALLAVEGLAPDELAARPPVLPAHLAGTGRAPAPMPCDPHGLIACPRCEATG